MHQITAKLITLERVEALVTCGWPKGAVPTLREQAQRLRREISPHILSAYDQLKTEVKDAVVGVFEAKCGGCQASLSKTALARLGEENDVSRCEHCERFIYLAAGHDLMPRHPSRELTGSPRGKGVVS
jgi:hypothetical protein